ncbi:LodA/GoxA family CTQ-dependent oxidase [Myxococcota bacterium]|nr:LodA/GoxA family CTQ-dependent oxidase [Myxococcota bacterium]
MSIENEHDAEGVEGRAASGAPEVGSEAAAADAPEGSIVAGTRRQFIGAAAGATALLAAGRAEASHGTPIYRIHPAIGFARVGNAPEDSFFIGPEAPGYGPLGDAPGTAVPPYKVNGLVKPQGARFRIYEYGHDASGNLVPVREVNLATPGVSRIEWRVHVANKKASFHRSGEGPAGESQPAPGLRNPTVTDRRSLEIDFGPRTIAGANALVPIAPGGSGNPASEACPLRYDGSPVIDSLGQLRTDAAGRLIYVGAKGAAAYQTPTPPALPHWANNDGWFDDVADGPVTATITVDVGGVPTEVPVDASGRAWVLSGPPDYAPRIPAVITGWDLLVDLAVRVIPIPANDGLFAAGGPLSWIRELKADFRPNNAIEFPNFVPNFTRDIQPLLMTGYNLWYVDGLITHRHNSLLNPDLSSTSNQAARTRNRMLDTMRPPVPLTPTGKGTMPKLLGDNPYVGREPDAVKNLPITRTQWGLLRRWAAGNFTPPNGAPPPSPAITAHGLDQAALEGTCGGAFYPGMEYSWLFRNPAIYLAPFRIDHAATSTYLTEQGSPIGPGYFSRQMALPWQADFNDCRNEGSYGWWPSVRPTDVLPSIDESNRVPWARATNRFEGGNLESTHEDMVNHWYKFGFVIDDGDVFYETERAATVP